MRPCALANGLASMNFLAVASRSFAAARSAFIMPVSPTGPGQTAFTRILSTDRHKARLLVSAMRAPLLVEYTGSWARGSRPALLDMFTIDPPPALRMGPMACLAARKAPLRFVPRQASHSDSV